MKRNLALILALLVLSSSLAACSDKGTNNEETKETTETIANASEESTEETENPNARLDSGLPDVNYNGYSFNIFSHSECPQDFDAEDFTGEPINDAKWQRIKTVEDLAGGIKIEAIKINAGMRDAHTTLGTSVQAGTNDYDLATISAYSSCNALTAGYLMDLTTIDNLDLTQPW